MSTSPSEPVVEASRIGVTFHAEGRSIEVLRNLSFTVHKQEIVTVIGPSGGGKSTAFNVIAGLLNPTEGEVRRFGPEVGYMPQRDLLLPWRRVVDNAALPLILRGVDRREAQRRAAQEFERFGLAGFERAYPGELSGGMRQRAALLRTVMTESELLLLDEPFGALDALTRREMQQWLLSIQTRLKKTILFITHDVAEAVYLADRVLVFGPRPARIVREIAVELPRPRKPATMGEPTFARHVGELIEALSGSLSDHSDYRP